MTLDDETVFAVYAEFVDSKFAEELTVAKLMENYGLAESKAKELTLAAYEEFMDAY
jgi:hypothetical protein